MRRSCLVLFGLFIVLPFSALSQDKTIHPQCPVETTLITPRVFPIRIYSTEEPGWRPSSRLTLDLQLKNKSDREIALMSFAFKFPGSKAPDREWKNEPVKISGQAGQTLHYDELIDIAEASKTVSVMLTKIRFADGEIYDAACTLGEYPIPAPIKLTTPASASQVVPVSEELSPPRVAKSLLFESGLLGVAKTVQSVMLSVVVETDGLPRDIKVESGGLSGDLNQKAIDALGKWEFTPAMIGDKLVATRINVQYLVGQYPQGNGN